MFGSNINHDQHSQNNVEGSRTHPANKITCLVEAWYSLEQYIGL